MYETWNSHERVTLGISSIYFSSTWCFKLNVNYSTSIEVEFADFNVFGLESLT